MENLDKINIINRWAISLEVVEVSTGVTYISLDLPDSRATEIRYPSVTEALNKTYERVRDYAWLEILWQGHLNRDTDT